MLFNRRSLVPLKDRGPLRVLFALTHMPVGGAESLLVNLIRGLDRDHFWPELVCLKQLGPLGEVMAKEIPAHTGLLTNKYDFRVLGRLTQLMTQRRIDALVTVCAGDKMFWGRLAAWRAGVPVILSALHASGGVDHITFLNRSLSGITDGFIGVAETHRRYLVEKERLPAKKIFIVPNGVDTNRFHPCAEDRATVRHELGFSADAPICGIVAALRPEKNHQLFLSAAAAVVAKLPQARFVIVGDGPERPKLEAFAKSSGLTDHVRFLGTRHDTPRLLAAFDLFSLTSDFEASPVSILEAMAVGIPVVSTRVGAVPESVTPGTNGFLVDTGNAEQLSDAWMKILGDRDLAQTMGKAGRRFVVEKGSLENMVHGYQDLITNIYERKCESRRGCAAFVTSDTIPETFPRQR